jgi:hypothetical protein
MTDRRRRSSAGGRPGFALVAVMLIGAMASVAAATLFTVAMASAKVAAADRRSELARAAADTGLADAIDRLMWGLAGERGAQVRESWTAGLGGEESYTVGLTQRSAVAGWPRTYDLEVGGEHGAAGAVLHAVVRLEPTRLPCGISVAGLVTCAAETTVRGCGLYAGSDVRGREKITFEATDDDSTPVGDPPADYAHGELWPGAAVHAGGHIYKGGSEEHAAAGPLPADTDTCTGGTPPQAVTMLPSSAIVADSAARSPALQTPYPGGSLCLSTLAGPTSGGGLVVVACAGSQPLNLSGWRAPLPLAPQVTLVVLGDACVVAGPTPSPEGVGMSGTLIVTGTLTVQTPTSILGSLSAGALEVDAPLLLDLPSGWRDQPPPGALSAEVVAQW